MLGKNVGKLRKYNNINAKISRHLIVNKERGIVIRKKNDFSLIFDFTLVNLPIFNVRACVCFSVK